MQYQYRDVTSRSIVLGYARVRRAHPTLTSVLFPAIKFEKYNHLHACQLAMKIISLHRRCTHAWVLQYQYYSFSVFLTNQYQLFLLKPANKFISVTKHGSIEWNQSDATSSILESFRSFTHNTTSSVKQEYHLKCGNRWKENRNMQQERRDATASYPQESQMTS